MFQTLFLVVALSKVVSGWIGIAVVAVLFILLVLLCILAYFAKPCTRSADLEKVAMGIEADFFEESRQTRFLEQLRSLDFPLFAKTWQCPPMSRNKSRVVNIIQLDLKEGRIYQFDFWKHREGKHGGARFGHGVVLIYNERSRVTKPIVVSNCLIESCFRRFWYSDHAELRKVVREFLRDQKTCRVEITNKGLLYSGNVLNVEQVEQRMEIARKLFKAVDSVAVNKKAQDGAST